MNYNDKIQKAIINSKHENEDIANASLEYLGFVYVDYFNNFLSVDGFADYYGISTLLAENALKIGREYIHKRDS